MSTAGGLHTAFERGDAVGCAAIQIFTSSPRQWKGRDLGPEQVNAFNAARERSGCRICFAHDIYLTRLGTRDAVVLEKSRAAFARELETCQRLDLPALVMHPVGDDDSDESAVLDRVAVSLDAVFAEVPDEGTVVCLETTAGQGANVGYRFEQLAQIMERVGDDSRVAVCLDTCHVFAAGYDISTASGVERTLDAFDRIIGLDRLRVLHLNDSRKGCGSRVDRHAHIGRGEIGEEGFRAIMTEPRLAGIPRVIETPKENEMDQKNLDLLRRLAGPP